MSVTVGLVVQRADLVVTVTQVVAGVGGMVLTEPDGAVGRRPADLLVVDAAAADPTDWPGAIPRIVVCRPGEEELGAHRGEVLAAQAVVTLPAGADWLHERLVPAPTGRPILGVQGALGGAGTSTVAVALAAVAHDGVLLDGDPDGAGLGLSLGLEDVPGVRWTDLPAGGSLDGTSLLAALPEAAGLPVLTGGLGLEDRDRAHAAVGGLRHLDRRAVVDLGRRDAHGLLGPADTLVIVLPSTVAGVLRAQRILLSTRAGRAVLAVREGGWIPRGRIAEELGDLACVPIPRLRRAAELSECGQLLTGATERSLRGLGLRLWEVSR